MVRRIAVLFLLPLLLFGCEFLGAGQPDPPDYVGTWQNGGADGNLYIQASETIFRQYLIDRQGACFSRVWEIDEYNGETNVMLFEADRVTVGQADRWHVEVVDDQLYAGPPLDSRDWRWYSKIDATSFHNSECSNEKKLTDKILKRALN